MTDFKERLAKIQVRNMKAKHVPKQHWPIEKKIEVVSQFLLIGNMKIVAASTGVGYDLVRKWKTEPWWAELEQEIRQTQNIEMDTKLSRIVEKSLDATLDRVENGDFFYDQKAGVVKRKPVNLRDVARVSVDMLSKRELLRGNATERRETTQVSVNEQLKLLAAEFSKWQEKPKDVIDVEMVEVVDAFHEKSEWEVSEGLPEGGGQLHLEASGGEEEDGSERGEGEDGGGGQSPQG